MNIVTLFQPHHSQSTAGLFTKDTTKKCADEIENKNDLCFAYYKPNAFYFAEGGWGDHMPGLGNHPDLDQPVLLCLKFDEFENSVVVNGNYCFRDVVRYLKTTGYI